jgi:uncharacterized tellurite resistance protein B-like protein
MESNQDHLKAQVARLMLIARADKRPEPREAKWIFGVAAEWGLSLQEINEITEKPEAFSDLIPPDSDTRISSFFQLLALSLSDHRMDSGEEAVLRRIGKMMGFSSDKLDTIMKKAREGDENWFMDMS